MTKLQILNNNVPCLLHTKADLNSVPLLAQSRYILLLSRRHTAALDPKTADMVMTLTDRLVRERGLTALMVTHNLRYATEYGDRLVMLHGGERVLDVRGDEKRATGVPDVLDLFNRISVECGN